MLGTHMRRFSSPTGVQGLARWNAKELTVLAIVAQVKNNGCCREFIRQAKEQFSMITVLSVDNPVLAAALERWGFTAGEFAQPVAGFMEKVDGMRWTTKIKVAETGKTK